MLASDNLGTCTCDLTAPLGLTQPTVSFHLKKLAIAGLVVPDRKVGKCTYSCAVPDALTGLGRVLSPAVA